MTQSDLSATLLAQLGLSYRSFTFARNVLAPNYTYPFAYYTFNDGFGFVDNTGVTVMDNVSGRGIEVTPRTLGAPYSPRSCAPPADARRPRPQVKASPSRGG